MYFLLLLYPILGAGIKYIDSAFDEKTFSKKIALVVAPLLAVIGGYMMLVNSAAATILLAIILGVLFTGKIDNYAHMLGFVAILPMVFLAGSNVMILPLVALVAAAVLDEVGNDIIDKRKKSSVSGFGHRFIGRFFEQRWLLKLAVLGVALLGLIPFYFFLAILFFDYAYLMVHWYSLYQQGIPVGWSSPTEAKPESVSSE